MAICSGINHTAELARVLDITPHAIYQWPDGAPIPQGRYWQLRAQHPELFDPQPQDRRP